MKRCSRYSPEVVFDDKATSVKIRMTGDQLRDAVREATAAFFKEKVTDCDTSTGDGIMSDRSADGLRDSVLGMDVDADEILVLQDDVEGNKRVVVAEVHREVVGELEQDPVPPVPPVTIPRVVVQSPTEVEGT